jgi:hypothetical protein
VKVTAFLTLKEVEQLILAYLQNAGFYGNEVIPKFEPDCFDGQLVGFNVDIALKEQ